MVPGVLPALSSLGPTHLREEKPVAEGSAPSPGSRSAWSSLVLVSCYHPPGSPSGRTTHLPPYPTAQNVTVVGNLGHREVIFSCERTSPTFKKEKVIPMSPGFTSEPLFKFKCVTVNKL